MESIINIVKLLEAHAYATLMGMALMLALAYAIKRVPDYLEARALKALEWMFAHGDAADREWFVATLKWAEAKYGPGTGADKAKAVVDKILSLLPTKWSLLITDKVRARAYELFQKSFDSLEDSVKKAITDNTQGA